MYSLIDTRLPCGPGHSSRPSRRCSVGRTVARAKKRDEAETGTEKVKGGLLGGLFGTRGGTQRLKVGEEGTEGRAQGKGRSAPSGGTKRLRNAPKEQGGGAGILQGFGSRVTGRKDPNTVFVAGSTGRLGLRIVRQLLLSGFKVRAGARNTERAREYAELAVSLGVLSPDAAKRLQVVTVDLEEEDTILAAIGNAGKVVQAIGAAENNVLDFGAPKRVDGNAAILLVDAAVEAGVEQYVMVTSLGTGKFGWPAGALNLFGGILIQKRRAEKHLEASGLQYVIVRPGGMERPTDDHKRTHNVRLQTRDKLFGGTVSRLQVAELISAAVANPSLAMNKVLEVVSETTAPLLDYETLLQRHPEDGSDYEFEEEEVEDEEEEPVPVAKSRTRAASPVRKAAPAAKEAAPAKTSARRTFQDFPSKQQEGIAEGIAQKEIAMKLGKEDPEPSESEKKLAEGIAQKEIVIATGKEEPTNSNSWFKRFRPGQKQQPQQEAPKAAAPQAAPSEQPVEEAPTFKPKKREVSSEDVERLGEARKKTAEARASREADFLARLEEERSQEAQKKAQAAEKKAAEARKKSAEAREAAAKKLQAAFQEVESKPQSKPQTKPAPAKKAAPTPASGGDKQALAQAKDNAKEARQWIDAWRSGQKGAGAKSNGSSSAAKAQSGSKTAPASKGGPSDVPPNVAEAREWIREWRARSLETKLPQNSRVKN